MLKTKAVTPVLVNCLTLLLATLVIASPATAQLHNCRAIGINEGFTDLPVYSLGQPTTVTADGVADRGFHAIKIWPLFQNPTQLAPIFTDDRLDLIVYRPLHQAQSEQHCGQTGYHWENIDYGQVATQLYQLYGNELKIIVLTGWEADNQIKFLYGGPTCSWPSQASVDTFKAILEQRQIGVRQARDANLDKQLRVYHAVEVRQVPDAPNNSLTVLEQIIPSMAEEPDLVSYSAWVSPATVVTKLNTIEAVTGFSRDRIFVGEWGCRVSNPNRTGCFQNHANNAFNWGVNLWIPWVYSGPGGANKYDLIDGDTGLQTPNGFSVLEALDDQISFGCVWPFPWP